MRMIPFGKPIIGPEEKQSVLDVLDGNILVHGPRTEEFETAFADYTEANYAVSVSSCTAALHLSYFYLGIGKNDEVIVPAQTHTATAHAIELCHGKPVFVDSERKTGNVDIDKIESHITERTKALSVVHYLGMPVDMSRINQIAEKYDLFVVEDCALSIGTYFKRTHAGLHGDVGCFSFYPIKHMTTAEGGMLITKNNDIATKIVKQRAFGVDKHVGERTIPGMYDVTILGFNYRLNEMQAALGIEQIKRLDDFLKKRKENYEALSAKLKDTDEIRQFQSSHGNYQSSYYCLPVLLSKALSCKRLEIIRYLREKGIGTSIYYPKPVPNLVYYKNKYGYADDSFPVASWISRTSIALPVGPHLNTEDMEYIGKSLKEAIREVK